MPEGAWTTDETMREGVGAWVEGVDQERMDEITRPKFFT